MHQLHNSKIAEALYYPALIIKVYCVENREIRSFLIVVDNFIDISYLKQIIWRIYAEGIFVRGKCCLPPKCKSAAQIIVQVGMIGLQ